MKSTKQARREAKSLFRETIVNGVMDEDRVRQVVRLVTEKRPRGYLGILAHFQRLVKLEIQRRTARIESAVALGAETQGTLRETLTRIYGPGLAFEFVENSALIGGLRIRVGSDVYDASVSSRLAALQESF